MPEAILVVDDNQTNLKLIKVILELEGYHVESAMDAAEVFSILKTFHPKLILMDIQLPDMDGLELTRILKNDPNYNNIIIIAVTAYAMKGDEQKALKAGCNGYITKPIDTDKLPRLVKEFLDTKSKIDSFASGK